MSDALTIHNQSVGEALPAAPAAYSAGASFSRRGFVGLAAAAFAALALPGCSSAAGSAAGAAASKTINVAYVQGGYPTSFTSDDGQPGGYEIEVLNEVAKILNDYTFEFNGLDQTAVFAGLSSGKYDLGLTNSFWTPERAKNYLLPDQNIGVSVLGFFTRTEYPNVNTLSDAAAAKLRLAPITAGDGNYYVVDDYNSKNPNAKIDLQATDDANAFTEAFDWVAQGRYDFSLVPLQYWSQLVEADDGPYHKYKDQLRFSIIGATKTWSFLAQGREDFSKEYSDALAQLKADGTLSQLSVKWYGVDNFTYLKDDTSNYSYL